MIDGQYVKRLGNVYFVTYSVNGVQKQWMGDRSELIDLVEKIRDTLSSEHRQNMNGKEIRQRGRKPSNRGSALLQ